MTLQRFLLSAGLDKKDRYQMNDSPAAQPLDHNLFRKALSRFPTGVGVATTVSASGQPRGMTISSFNSVSMTPPLILWSIGLEAACFEDFRQADKFAVNILSAHQAEVSQTFASAQEDRFTAVDWSLSAFGVPLIHGAAAIFECQVWARYPGGDHDIIVGEVRHLTDNDKTPLLYGLGRLTSFPLEG